MSERVRHNQERQKLHHNADASLHHYKSEDLVFVHNFSLSLSTKVWLPGHIVAAPGPLSYLIRLVENHWIVRCHVDHIRTRSARIMSDPPIAQNDDVYSDFPPSLDSNLANEAPLPASLPCRSSRHQHHPNSWHPS